MRVNKLLVLLPKNVTEPMMTTAMKNAMRAYSVELAPRSPRRPDPVERVRRRRKRIGCLRPKKGAGRHAGRVTASSVTVTKR